MQDPGLAGRELRALVLLAPEFGSGVRQSRAQAAGALWGAPCADARGGVVLPWPRVGGRWALEVQIAGSASGPELLGNRPTLPSALLWPLASEGVAATAIARISVGGTLVRHEVTAAHTRSLFCSLQLFFSPLARIVAIPVVHKNS